MTQLPKQRKLLADFTFDWYALSTSMRKSLFGKHFDIDLGGSILCQLVKMMYYPSSCSYSSNLENPRWRSMHELIFLLKEQIENNQITTLMYKSEDNGTILTNKEIQSCALKEYSYILEHGIKDSV